MSHGESNSNFNNFEFVDLIQIKCNNYFILQGLWDRKVRKELVGGTIVLFFVLGYIFFNINTGKFESKFQNLFFIPKWAEGSEIQYDKQTILPTKSEHALKFVWDTFQNISEFFFVVKIFGLGKILTSKSEHVR